MSEEDTPEVMPEVMTIHVRREMLQQAMLDALRLDYGGKLAGLFKEALEENSDHLKDFVAEVIHEATSDPEFRATLKADFQRKLKARVVPRLDAIARKLPPEQLDILIGLEIGQHENTNP